MGSPSVARGSRPRGEVAAFPWNQWQRFPGMGGRLAMESVAAFVWNRWQLWHGISGNVRVESPAALPWNQWQVWRGIRTLYPFSRFSMERAGERALTDRTLQS